MNVDLSVGLLFSSNQHYPFYPSTSRHKCSSFHSQFCINEESCVVFVVSTTGDGEPPDTVRKFYRRINKKTLQSDYLKKLNFAFLGVFNSYIYIELFMNSNLLLGLVLWQKRWDGPEGRGGGIARIVYIKYIQFFLCFQFLSSNISKPMPRAI